MAMRMPMHAYAWLCMAMHAHAWLCMPMYGYAGMTDIWRESELGQRRILTRRMSVYAM